MGKIRNSLGRNLKTKRTIDKLDQTQRAVLMSKIKSKKTYFEQEFFKDLKRNGIKFQAHPKGIFGRPDLVVHTKKVCIFLDSDFWHGWQYPRWKHKLKNDFWRNKIESNRKRDKLVTRRLRSLGWKVIRIWEHNLKVERSQNLITLFDQLK